MPEQTTKRVRIIIFGKNKYSQIKPVTRNVFTNIIFRMAITGFVAIIDHAATVKSVRHKELYWYHKLKTYVPYGFNERYVYAANQTR